MSDREEDIMCYTPLKRQKTKPSDSTCHSQTSRLKAVDISKYFAHQISSSQPVRNSATTLTKQSFHHSSNYSASSSKKKTLMSVKTSSFTSAFKQSTYANLNKRSQKSENYQAPRVNLGRINTYNRKTSGKPSISKTNECSSVTHVTNRFDEDETLRFDKDETLRFDDDQTIMFDCDDQTVMFDGDDQTIRCDDDKTNKFDDDEIPDIDFTQVDDFDTLVRPTPSYKQSELTSTCRKYEKERSPSGSESTRSSNTVVSFSLLDKMPEPDTFISSTQPKLVPYGSNDVLEIENLGSYEKGKGSPCEVDESKSKDGSKCEVLFTCTDNDLIKPVQEKIEKVNSWLNKSLDHLNPQKVEIQPNHSGPYETVQIPSSTSDVINHSTSSTNDENVQNPEVTENPSPTSTFKKEERRKNVEEAEPRACIHLHFHVHTPQKFVQPTLQHFFGQTSKSNAASVDSKCQRKKAKGSNGSDVMKAWATIMSSMRGAKKDSGVQRKLLQNENMAGSGFNSSKHSSVAYSGGKGTRTCPFYKFVEGTNFVVDAFSYGYIGGVSIYFLSHFHADHFKGLHKNFNKFIYCSQITANLVRQKIRVQNHFLRPLPLEEPRIIDGVEVTLYDANHCPGAVMFLFRLRTGKTLLHVGDFRADPSMENISVFWNHSLDVLYLDTTYLDPQYDFASQEDILEKCIRIVREHTHNDSKTLFLVGSYTIGKEKVFKAIARYLNCKIYAPTAKQHVLRCLEDQQITGRLTENKFEAQVHVVAMAGLSPGKLRNYMETMYPTFKILVALRPTGWEHSTSSSDLENLKPKQIGNIYIYGVSYSEHSSYYELQRFVQFTQPKKIIPTVNNETVTARQKMEDIFRKWQAESVRCFSRKRP